MKIKALFVILLIVLSTSDVSAKREKLKMSSKERKKAYESLNQAHRYWFDMVTYISLEEEQIAFLKLTSDRDRTLFINAYWAQRDPTPGTPENEYKAEIEKRFAYVNEHFRIGSGRPGWMTDRGKFYMILGKPHSIDRFDSKAGLYPARVWYYYGDRRLGLPTYFCVTFYRPGGTTEWKLYNPALDGPHVLLIQHQPVDRQDIETIYGKILELAPTLAQPAVSMMPQEVVGGFNQAMMMRSNFILSNIYNSPKRSINASYATNFLNYKGFVNVDASINFIEHSHRVSVMRYAPFDFNFVNISLRPKTISVGYHEDRDQYFFNFELTVSLKKGDTFIYQYNKNYDFYIDADNVDSLRGNGIVIHDAFPVVPGDYQLLVFAKNTVGKEFTYFDMDISSPAVGPATYLTTPVLGHSIENRTDTLFYPYKVNNARIYINPDNAFRLRETPQLWVGVYNLKKELWEQGRVVIDLRGLNERKKFQKTYEILLKNQPFTRDLNLVQQLSAEGLSADYYECQIRLFDGADVLVDTKNCSFSVSPLATVGYPRETFKQARMDNPYYFYFVLASQYENTGDLAAAERFYQRALNNKTDFVQGRIALLELLNRRKKYTRVLVDVEALKSLEDKRFEYHLIKGTALYGMKDYQAALTDLLQANELYNSDIRVLNLLGFTLLNLQEYGEALKVFEASLQINKDQSFIKRTIAEVKKKTGTTSPDGSG